MKTDKIIIGLTIFLLLMVGGKALSMYLTSKDQGDLPTYLGYFKGTKPDDIVALKIDNLGKELAINKDDKSSSSWLVDGYVADKAIVDTITTSLLAPKNTMIVAESITSHDRLGVGTESASLSLIKKDGSEYRVSIGNSTSGGKNVKLGNGNAVYLVAGLLPQATSVIAGEWADKEPYSVKTDEIKSISVERGKNVVKIIKDGVTYKDQAGKSIDPASLTTFMTALESIKAMNVISEAELKLDPVLPETKLSIELINGTTTTLTISYPKERLYGSLEVSSRKGQYKLADTIVKTLDLDINKITYLK